MSFFPFIDLEASEFTEDSVLPMYKEIAWDFASNQPILVNNELVTVEGVEAIKVWVYKAILTPRFALPIYSWNYGSEIESLIGQPFSVALTKEEATRYIKEALSTNPYILDTRIVSVDMNEDMLNIHVELSTIYGEVTVIV